MAREPRHGDPSRRDDDRYLFLEALLSARDCFYISYVARDERSNEARERAVPVSELRDYIDRHWAAAPDDSPASAALTRRHRLKPFHPAYFEARRRAVQLSPRMAAGRSRRGRAAAVLPGSRCPRARRRARASRTAALLPAIPCEGVLQHPPRRALRGGRGDGRRQRTLRARRARGLGAARRAARHRARRWRR
ncbi:MAG: exodeoxyribonuclease V subunit gamma [Gammaproteobacteria bacterium]|nr:exodeoxyribonuclease V subunit gamma [Gammaproteobacteria bacterium]